MKSTLRFGELVDYNIGGGWGTESADAGSADAAYVIRGTDIPRALIGDISTIPLRYHSESNLRARVLLTNDIVFEVSGGSKGRPVGRALSVKDTLLSKFADPVMCASFCKLVRVNSQVADPRFVFRALQAAYIDGRLDAFQVQSTGITNFRWKPFLAQFLLDLPPRPEQEAIAATLDLLDDLIENNRRRVEVLEEMARAIYREWFVNFRYPGHENAALVESPLGPIPEGWRVARVGEICERIQAGGTPRRSNPAFWEQPEVDWYKTGDLTDSILIRSSERISRVAFTSSAARAFQAGTILMAIYGSPTVGRLGLIESVSSANQAALGLVAESTATTTEHLWFVLRELRENLNQIAQGAAQQNVSKQKVEDAQIVLPPIGLVRRFTAAAGPPWRLSHVLRREAAALKALRDLLLPMLVTGQIDVSSLDLDRLVEGSVA